MKRTPTKTIGWTVEDETGRERDVTLTFNLYSGEKADRWSPGYPPEQECIAITYDDTGEDVPEGLIDEDRIYDLGCDAAEAYDDRMEAMREDAAIAKAERRRERMLDE